MSNNRRGFLRNLGAVLAGAAAVGTVASDAEASVSVVSEPVKAPEPQIVYRDIPTFDEVLVKAKEGKELNDIEVLVFVGELTLAAHKIDIPERRKLCEQGTTAGFYDMINAVHPNKSAIYYWSVLHNNVNNLVKVHRHAASTVFTAAGVLLT